MIETSPEWQADFFICLAIKDDQECVEWGLGRFVDLRDTERICLEGVAKIMGYDQ